MQVPRLRSVENHLSLANFRRPYGTRTSQMAAFPTLKRGANDRCAYGAILATFMDFAGPKGSLVLGMTVALGFGVGGNAGPSAALGMTGCC